MRKKTNLSNKFRPRNVKPIFELISEKKDVSDAMMIEDLRWRAETIVRGAEWLQIKAMREKLNTSPDVNVRITTSADDLQGMKLQLIQRSKTHPKMVIIASDDQKSKRIVRIYEAQNFNILFCNEENTWYSNFEGKPVKLHTVEADKDRIESLVEYFLTEKGDRDYNAVAKALEKILKATA